VALNLGMLETVIAIMVEILNFVGIAAKEIKQSRISQAFTLQISSHLTKPFAEKYLKKLIGNNDIEDVLKRLDALTQEEARVAAAELLKPRSRTRISIMIG
jgi:hypothetical protein